MNVILLRSCYQRKKQGIQNAFCDRILLDSYGITSYLRMARSVMVEGVAAAVVVVLVLLLIVVVGDEVELEASVYKNRSSRKIDSQRLFS